MDTINTCSFLLSFIVCLFYLLVLGYIVFSLCTTLCLQWEPEVIAVALLFLAGKLSKFEVVDWNGRNSKHTAWWDMFVEDITMDLLEDICHQVRKLYI